MNKEYKIFSDFKGFGKPEARIWFVGLEEATNFDNDFNELLIKYNKEYFPFEKEEIKEKARQMGNKYTSVYDIMSKIITGIQDKSDWKTYRNNTLLTKDGNEFQMNLYPLGKKHLKAWDKGYEKKFKFNNKKEYLSEVRISRFDELFDYWCRFSPELTICFGKGNFQEFKDVFKVSKNNSFDDGNLLFYPNEKILMTPFFQNGHMSQLRIDKAVNVIKSNLK